MAGTARRRWIWRAVCAALMVLPFVLVPVGIFTNPLAASRSELSYVSLAAIYAVVAVATGMFVNLTGLPSVAQAGLWGVGAYAAGAAMASWGISFWLSFPFAMVVAAVIGVPGGALALRTRGMAFLIVTLAFSSFLVLLMENLSGITRGYNGMPFAGGTPALGSFEFDTPAKLYYLYLVFLFLVLGAYWLIRRSGLGRRTAAIKQNEDLARSLSINAYWHQLMMFELSVALTSIAGPLILLQQQIVTPTLFTADQFLKVYLMIMLGGLATIGGPAVGAWIVGALPEWLGAFGDIDPNVQELIFAVLLVFFVLIAKRGLLGSLQHWLVRPDAPAPDELPEAEEPSTPSSDALRGAAAIDAALGASGSHPLRDEVILQVAGLSHSYGANKVLDDVDFEVRVGEVRGLIGPNGSGKTTTLNCVSGYVQPSKASVMFQGKEMRGRRFDQIAGEGVVRTFQQPELFGDFTARETIELALRATGAAGCGKAFNASMPDDADYYLTLCMLGGVADQPSSALPYGHARLLGVAAALATRPRLLMLDEPAAGLGSLDRVRLAQVIREARDMDVAIVLVDHDMSFLLPICDRLTVLDYGRKIAEGDPQTVCRDQDVVAAYLGTGFAERHSLELAEGSDD